MLCLLRLTGLAPVRVTAAVPRTDCAMVLNPAGYAILHIYLKTSGVDLNPALDSLLSWRFKIPL